MNTEYWWDGGNGWHPQTGPMPADFLEEMPAHIRARYAIRRPPTVRERTLVWACDARRHGSIVSLQLVDGLGTVVYKRTTTQKWAIASATLVVIARKDGWIATLPRGQGYMGL